MRQIKKLAVVLVAVSLLTSILSAGAAEASVARGAAAVTAAALNVRTGADTAAPVTATLSEGDTVVVLDVVGDMWYYINDCGTVGYVASMYMSELLSDADFEAGGKLTGDDTLMRAAPSTEADVLGTYAAGTILRVTGIKDGWYKVSCAGISGYVRSDLMDITSDGSDVPKAELSSLGQQIAAYALQFVGYRYVYGGSSPTTGFDCSGFAYYIYGKFDYGLLRTASQQYRSNGVSVSKSQLLPGDLVFFSSNGGRSVTHVGIFVGGSRFVHASTWSTGVIISDLTSSYYVNAWYGAKRIV